MLQRGLMAGYAGAIRLAARAAFLIGVLVVSVLSLTGPDATITITPSDKLQHALAYFVLMACAAVGYRNQRTWLVVAVALIVWGSVLEGLQALTPHRAPELMDALANAAGVVVACILAWLGSRAAAVPSRRTPVPEPAGRDGPA